MGKIFAFIETRENKVKNNGFETASTAHKFGKELQSDVEVLLVGKGIENLAPEIGKYGVSKVLICEDEKLAKYSTTAYAKAISETAKQRGADILFLSATAMGKDLAPRVSAKLEAGLAPDCTSLRIENGSLIASRPVYAGKAYTDVKINSAVKIYSLRPNVFKAEQADSVTPDIEKIQIDISDSDLSVVVKETTLSSEKLDVAEANIIVSGGRGLKAPENYKLVEDLAKVLGAAVGASRAVVDAGWRPHSEQVGQTGKTVSPNLYIACGISGAIQHLAGMSSSKCIVAINKDKDAPIFQIADYGIVGDAFEVLPALTEEFKKVLSN